MAEDMRIKAYPPLPPKGPRITIVLPTTGDLCLRSQLPDAFQQQLLIHANPAYYQYYTRFVVLRKFIVMSSEGDLYTQTVRTTLELQDLPKQQLLPLPSISPWDIVKILDLVQCFSANASWELVRVRWQSGMVTWLPIELLERNFGNLLQAFYVSSINSWGFRDRIYAHSIRSFQTEVELWLHHDEFRQFYQYLRRRRAMAANPQLSAQDMKPTLNRSVGQSQPTRAVPAPARVQQQQFAATNHNRNQPQQQPQARPPVEIAREQRELPASNTSRQSVDPVPSRQQQASAVVEREHARGGAQNRNEQAPPAQQRVEKAATTQRNADAPYVRKRPKRVDTVTSDTSDNDDDGQDLTSGNVQPRTAGVSSSNSFSPGSSVVPKQFKRLRKQQEESAEEDSDDDIVLRVPTSSTRAEQPKSSSESTPTPTSSAPSSGAGSSKSSEVVPVLTVIGEDNDDLDESSLDVSEINGEIHCVCGAESIGTYAGRWLHCWNDECGVWEHADCVGVIGHGELTTRYICSKCDPTAFRSRLTGAKEQLTAWLFQCCESKNSVQLLKLLRENAGQESKKWWRNPKDQNMTLLMKAAQFGLANCVQYLVQVAKVDVFATDAASLNVLHHAVLSGRPKSVLFLLNQEPKLLDYQDKRGRTPFHCMLESTTLSDICLSLLTKDRKLAVVGDLESNFPIHYACRAITKSTVEIYRIMLQAQPTLMQERSGDGLLPFHLICKAASVKSIGKLSITEAAMIAKESIRLMLDVDVLGTFINARAPNGWMGVHFAAASGNHELLAYLCGSEFVDIHATTGADSSETALHIAAKGGFHLCVRTLLRMGSRTTAKDAQGWIPILYADNAACIQEFIPYKLTKQLSRLNRMTMKFEQKEIIEQWKRRIVTDPTCFDMINDWCQRDLERIERMNSIFLNNAFILRLDNKLDYFDKFVFPTLRDTSRGGSCEATPVPAAAVAKSTSSCRKGIKFVFSSSRESYWKQFVHMGKQFEPEDFRAPMQFTTDRAPAVTDKAKTGCGGDRDDFVLKLVLIRLASDLSAIESGFLVQSGSPVAKNIPQPYSEQEQSEKLLDFYLLGELVAHLVLYNVSLRGIMNFSSSFLRCAFGLGTSTNEPNDARWLLYGRSFAGGFTHVIPSVLEILHPDEFRVLINGRRSTMSARAVDWENTMDWSSFPESAETRAWLSRLISELVVEEQQLVLLLLAESFTAVNQHFFLLSNGGTAISERQIKVLRYTPTEDDGDDTVLLDDDDADEQASKCDALMPHVDHEARSISLPRYSDYAAFRSAMLRLIRRTDSAFRRR